MKNGRKKYEIDAERYCFENADGIMHKGSEDELSHLKKDNMLGNKIGHCLMRRMESINIKNNYDFWLASKYLKERKKFENI